MKNSMFAFLVLGTLLSTAVAETPRQEVSIGVSASFGDAAYFHSSLSPYGEWLELETGFHAWRPRHMHAGWRPYLHGHWSWTRYGWYWISSEPFGWAVFHYGRWYYDDYYGWIWIPDRTWGPSWVEWRYDDDYIGWAPLPPYASFSFHFGIRFTTHWFASERYWSFVRYRHMLSPSLYREIVPGHYTRRLIRTTRSAGRYEYDGEHIINRGVERTLVERRGGYRRLEPVEVQETNAPRERIIRNQNRERIETYRPQINTRDQSEGRIEARRLERRSSLDLQRIERPSREVTRVPNQGEPGRGTVREESRPAVRTPQPPTTRDEGVRRSELPDNPIPQNRQIERRREERTPTPSRQQVEPKRERTITAPERSQRPQRETVTAPRSRSEQARPAPSIRQESSRGSERGRREGGRKRD
jgi:hypothetical protein